MGMRRMPRTMMAGVFGRSSVGASSSVRRRYRPSVVVRATGEGERGRTDAFELAAAVVRMRRAQDDCLDLVLSEMAALSKEVRALRDEVAELKAPRGEGASSTIEGGVYNTKTSGVGVVEGSPGAENMRAMLDALIPDEDETATAAPTTAAPTAPEVQARSAEEKRAPSPFGVQEEEEVPVAVDTSAWCGDGTDRSHLWPLCKTGDDDIYLMSTIQAALNDAGFWAGEEDEADMYFGPSTQDALCYFQASKKLPETGVVDADTWRALLGEEKYAWGPVPGAIGFEDAAEDTQAAPEPAPSAAAKSAKEWSEGVKSLVDDADNYGDEPLWGDEKNRPAEPTKTETQQTEHGHKWPVLRQEDGGMEVHKLQVLLDMQGFYSGEEDMEYWFFGYTTENALGTFQASNKLPDTGLTCVATWRALLGEERMALGPEAAFATVPDGDYPMDLADQDRVFLLGEGRFEMKKKTADANTD